MPRDAATTPADGWGERTSADLSSLLVELGRAVKGIGFYPHDDKARQAVVGRSYLAWKAELERTGPLELELSADGVNAPGLGKAPAFGPLRDVTRLLGALGVERLRFTPELTQASFGALAALLAREPGALRGAPAVVAALAEVDPSGIEIDDGAPAQHFENASLGSALLAGAPPPTRPESHGQSASPGPPDGAAPHDSARPPSHAPSSPATGARDPEPEPEQPERVLTGAMDPNTGVDSARDPNTGGDPNTGVDSARDPNTGVDSARDPNTGVDSARDPNTDGDPNTDEAAASGSRGEELRWQLEQLDGTTDDARYEERAQTICTEAALMAREGLADDAYGAMVALADHAVGEGGRSAVQARIAQTAFERLASGVMLATLIERACSPETSVCVRAAQLLLQLGERAVDPLLARIEQCEDPELVPQLSAVVVALGERAGEALLRVIDGSPSSRSQIAVRLAGRLQSPRLVPSLIRLLHGGEAGLRREAAKALARIGNPTAGKALSLALESSDTNTAHLAAHALGDLGDREAGSSLLEGLERACARPEPVVATELIRSLGRIGAHEAIPRLIALLERRTLLRRQKGRKLKLAVIGALERMPAGEARRALERVARGSDRALRERALQALMRRRREESAGSQGASLQ